MKPIDFLRMTDRFQIQTIDVRASGDYFTMHWGRRIDGKLVTVEIGAEWIAVRRRPKPYIAAHFYNGAHCGTVYMVEHGRGQRTAHVSTADSERSH